MPDSFPFPPEGLQSHDDRALDSLLSGDPDVPESLRPVADTLNALRAAPSARELRGEAAARAQFRALSQEARWGADDPRTLEMPAVPSQRRRGAPVRAVRRRQSRTRLAGLAAAAAVLVAAVVAVTYTGYLPSRLQSIAHQTISAPPVRAPSDPGTSGLQSASARPVAPSTTAPAASAPASQAPAPSAGAPGKSALCEQFWSDLKHARPGRPGRPGRMPWETPRYGQLVAAAGGPRKVFAYCYPVWEQRDAPEYGRLPSYPPYFPRQWGDGGAQGNGQDNGQGQGQQQPQNSGDQQQPEPGRQPQNSSSAEPHPSNSPASQPGNQGQNSGASQN
jgi:hypothetical protein